MKWETWEGSSRALIWGTGSEFAYGDGRKSKSGQLLYWQSVRLRPEYRYFITWTSVMDSLWFMNVMLDVLKSSLKEGTVACWNGHTPTSGWWRIWKAKASVNCLSVSREGDVGVAAITLIRQASIMLRSEDGGKFLPKQR